MAASRFVHVSSKEINDLKQNAAPSKVKEATKSCVGFLQVKFGQNFLHSQRMVSTKTCRSRADEKCLCLFGEGRQVFLRKACCQSQQGSFQGCVKFLSFRMVSSTNVWSTTDGKYLCLSRKEAEFPVSPNGVRSSAHVATAMIQFAIVTFAARERECMQISLWLFHTFWLTAKTELSMV